MKQVSINSNVAQSFRERSDLSLLNVRTLLGHSTLRKYLLLIYQLHFSSNLNAALSSHSGSALLRTRRVKGMEL